MTINDLIQMLESVASQRGNLKVLASSDEEIEGEDVLIIHPRHP